MDGLGWGIFCFYLFVDGVLLMVRIDLNISNTKNRSLQHYDVPL